MGEERDKRQFRPYSISMVYMSQLVQAQNINGGLVITMMINESCQP